jgi:esterase/lipase
MHAPAPVSFGPLARWVGLATRRRGQGQAVLVLPEYGAGAESTRELRRLLQQAGFAAHDWGMGADKGPRAGLEPLLRRLEERVIDVFEVERGSVTLIGCGLSGIYAREVAKRTTPIVRQVITIGTPVRLRDPYQRCEMLRNFFTPTAGIDTIKMNRLRQRPPVPCTSIYSVTDELVPPELAEEPESITTENLVVPAKRHADLMLHAKTIEAITHRVARADEEWRLFAE